jgi:hypothetical protein
VEEGQEFEPKPKSHAPEPLSKPMEEEELFRVSDPSRGAKDFVSGGAKSTDYTYNYAVCGAIVRVHIEPCCVVEVHDGT